MPVDKRLIRVRQVMRGPFIPDPGLTSDANGQFELFDPVSSTAAFGFYRVR